MIHLNRSLSTTRFSGLHLPYFSAVRTWIVPVLRLILGVVFIWSSLWKLYQPYEFLRDVYNYELLGAAPGYFAAVLLPWLELVLGLALTLNILRQGASVLSVLLLIVFLMGQAHTLYVGLQIPCGCFSANGESISYRNIITTGSALFGAILVASSELFSSSETVPRVVHDSQTS